jgi:hypothetical protein
VEHRLDQLSASQEAQAAEAQRLVREVVGDVVCIGEHARTLGADVAELRGAVQRHLPRSPGGA